MSDEEDLSAKLEGLLSEVTKVMESRKERIEELRAEIDQIEKENEALRRQSGLFCHLLIDLLTMLARVDWVKRASHWFKQSQSYIT